MGLFKKADAKRRHHLDGGPGGFTSGDPFDVDYDGETEVEEELKGYGDTTDERGDQYLGPTELDWADVGEYFEPSHSPSTYRTTKDSNEEIPTYTSHQKSSSREEKELTIKARDPDHVLRDLLETIQDVANGGHSFPVVVDPEMSEYRQEFYIDGDGGVGIDEITAPAAPSKQEFGTDEVKTAGLMDAESKLDQLPDYPEGPSVNRGGDVNVDDVFIKKYERMIFGVPKENSRKWTKVNLPVADLIPCQDYIPREGLRSYIKNPPHSLPEIVKFKGKYYVAAGTTRIGAAILRGENSVDVKLVEWDGRDWNKVTAAKDNIVTDSESEPMDTYEFQGLPVVVENKAGSERKWTDQSGKSGSTEMLYDYGFIDGYHGVDGDEVDVYIGPNKDSEWAYVIHQMKTPEFEQHDEDKVMLGFDNEEEAKQAYLDHYDNPDFYGGMTAMKMDDFKQILEHNASDEDDPAALTHLVGEAMKIAVAIPAHLLGDVDYIAEQLESDRDLNLEDAQLDVNDPAMVEEVARDYVSAYIQNNEDVAGEAEELVRLISDVIRDIYSDGSMKTANRPDSDLNGGTDRLLLSPETQSVIGNGGDLHTTKSGLPSGYQGDDKAVRVAMMEMGLLAPFKVTALESEMTCRHCGHLEYEHGDEGYKCRKCKDCPGFEEEEGETKYSSKKKTATEVGHETVEFKKGDKVLYAPTNRTGKIMLLNAHTATVEFDDDKNPQIRNVFVADLKKAVKKEAVRVKVVTVFYKGDQLQHMVLMSNGRLAIKAIGDGVADVMFNDKEEVDSLAGKAGVQVEWSAVKTEEVPVSFLRQTGFKVDKNATKAASMKGLQVLKDLYTAAKSGEHSEGDEDPEDMAEKEAMYFSEGMFGYTLDTLSKIVQADGKTRNYKDDLPESVVRQTIRNLETQEKKRDLSMEEASNLGLLRSEEEHRQQHKSEHEKDASFEDETPTAPVSDDEFDALMDPLLTDKVAKRFDREMGLAQHEYYGIPPMHVGAEKLAAEELEVDIFGDDKSYDFTPGERSISAISVQNLMEERPRLMADRSALINAAAKAYRKVLKPIRAKFTVEQVSLQKISAKQVDETLGMMVTGMLTWHVILASHAHRRRAAVDLEMPVVAGQPVEAVTMVTSAGERLPFTTEALDQVMNVRRDKTKVSRGYSGVPQSHHFEY